MPSARDVMGMNSPSKKRPEQRNYQSLSVKPLQEFKKGLDKRRVIVKKHVGFGSSVPIMAPVRKPESKKSSRF